MGHALRLCRVLSPVLAVALAAPPGAMGQPFTVSNADQFDPWPFPGDLDRNLLVNGADLGAMLGAWGDCAGCPADLTGDGAVNGADLGMLLGAWGPAPLQAPWGVALVYPRGPIDFTQPVTPGDNPANRPLEVVLLADLGEYDPETGALLGPNFDAGTGGFVLDGKYLAAHTQTSGSSSFPFIPRLAAVGSNDFRTLPVGDATHDDRTAFLYSAEAHLYHAISDYRRRLLDASFIADLGLDSEREANLNSRQFRLGGLIGQTLPLVRPVVKAHEDTNGLFFQLFPFANVIFSPVASQSPANPQPFVSYAFDPGFVAGEYAGLAAFWIIGTDEGFPSESGFGETSGWIQNMLPALSDGINVWTAYRYEKLLNGPPEGTMPPPDSAPHAEVFRYKDFAARVWSQKAALGDTLTTHGLPVDKGRSIDNVMMFDELNTTRNMVFPFTAPALIVGSEGPINADLAAVYIGAIFYDIANRAGLGDRKADLLLWKTISLIDHIDTLPMREWGQLVLTAAGALWPVDPGDPGLGGVYDEDIRKVLIARGIAVDIPLTTPIGDASVDFKSFIPAPIGSFPVSLEKSSANGFGSSMPETQPDLSSNFTFFSNGYTHLDGGVATVAYQTYQHSNYGPCDMLFLTDGTFTSDATSWSYNNDGSYFIELTGREMANRIILAPNTTIRWMRVRGKCSTQAEGYYIEDVRSLGFRVIDAVSDGFSFRVRRPAGPLTTNRYLLEIADPSLNEANWSETTYDWTISTRTGSVFQASGGRPERGAFSEAPVDYTAPVDEPLTISITRTRGGVETTLELDAPSSYLDARGEDTFVLDLTALAQPVAEPIAAPTRRDGAIEDGAALGSR